MKSTLQEQETGQLMNSRIEAFCEMVRGLAVTLAEMGQELVKLLEVEPNAKRLIMKREPMIGMSFLNQLEAVGRGTLHPKLAMTSNAGYNRLQRLPLSDQSRYLEEPIELLVTKDGDYDVLLVKVEELNPDQARQVFDGNSVRSASAQRAYIENLKTQEAVKQGAKEFANFVVARDGTITFPKGYTGTLEDLLVALTQESRRLHARR